MESSVIYVDIESLMDIRQGVLLSSVNVDAADDVSGYLVSEEYNFRESDTLKFLDRPYHEYTLTPKLSYLENSTVTHILVSIISKLNNMESRDKFFSQTTRPEILLNVYPFTLTDEQREMLRNLVFFKLGSGVMVEVVRLPLKEVSPLFIKTKNIVSCFMYNFTDWMNLHSTALQKTRTTDCIFYFPPIYRVTPTPEELAVITKLGFSDPVVYMEYLLSHVANINFLPTVFYSNIVTSAAYLEKMNVTVRNEMSSSEEATKDYGDIIPEI